MKNFFRFCAPLAVLAVLVTTTATTEAKGVRGLATITGTVRDNKGVPLAGAVIQLLRDGAKQIIKQTYTSADGNFALKIPAGRYALKAVAQGFSDVVFSSVEVSPSTEIAYRFNLEPAGSAKTLVNQRNDKDNVKWTLRSASSRRSIFQAKEGQDATIAAVENSEADATNPDSPQSEEPRTDANGQIRPQGVVETYFASSESAFAPGYEGVNFAVAMPASERIDLIFAGQTGIGPAAPKRFEATAKFRVDDRHKLNLSGGGARLFGVLEGRSKERRPLGQMSVRAIDEWIVRDGVVVVMGLDYSRFIGAGNAASITPRLGVQFDANATTRLRASYAPGGSEMDQQSTAGFEDTEVIFKRAVNQPIAFVGGRAVMGRSRRLEFGVEHVLDNNSRVEAAAFLDLTSGRGVGLLALPLSGFSGESAAPMISVADQDGSARGIRVVYSRRLNKVWSAAAGYSFGRGQELSPNGFTNPANLFSNGFFQTAAFQFAGDWSTGTHVQTVFRFSPQATVFAIDPFAGRLAVYDPSLSVQVSQDLPKFGLPVKAQAVIDARNLLDVQSRISSADKVLEVGSTGRSLRGGILVRF